MPRNAMRYNKDTHILEKIDAKDCTINDVGKKFRCCTEGCPAIMTLVSASENKSAYFKSKNKKQHISVQCVRNSINFNPSTYDENTFDLNFAFNSMMGNTNYIHRGNTGVRQGNVGGGRHLRICTLPKLYAMCISKNKNDTYNGILINDLLVDEENFQEYNSGISGYKIVETSFYHKIKDENALRLNYPVNNKGINSWVKISFESEELFWKQYNKLKESLHIEPIAIAGDWKKVENNNIYHSECTIYNEKQIYYVVTQ